MFIMIFAPHATPLSLTETSLSVPVKDIQKPYTILVTLVFKGSHLGSRLSWLPAPKPIDHLVPSILMGSTLFRLILISEQAGGRGNRTGKGVSGGLDDIMFWSAS